MAKKVRQRPEETEESHFEFPVFDEVAFIRHELELTYGMLWAIATAVLAALASAVLVLTPDPQLSVGPALFAGLAVVVASFYFMHRLRAPVRTYTKGDWAGVIALSFFGWLGLWFLLASLFAPH